MLSNLLLNRKIRREITTTRNKLNAIEELLTYWWMFIGIFLLLWLGLSLTGSPTGIAFAWALLGSMFFGLPLACFVVVFKRISRGGAPDLETYWPTQKLSQNQADEWAETLQEGRQSNSQIDEIINHYRNNPDELDIPKAG